MNSDIERIDVGMTRSERMTKKFERMNKKTKLIEIGSKTH